MTEQSFIEDPQVEQIKGHVRVEDKMRLRELELETQYELKYLSDKVKDLTTYVESRLETETVRFQDLNKRVTLITYLILAQLAGINAPQLLSMAKTVLPM